MEKLIRTHIIQHMKVNDLFSNKQYGFIAGRSTALQLLEVIDKWSEPLDEGLDIDCIYTDFQKAFDKVPHKRLIKKIENYGITNPILSWIQDFLTRRYQQVSINRETSNQKEVTSGIPQGSVLGPILFVIYINDLPEAVESAAYLFADDTKIFRVINSLDDQHILQNDLVKLENWSDKWLLKFHPEKCKLFTI
jgi:retron-type reverse transcriptase